MDKLVNVVALLLGIALSVWAVNEPGGQLLVAGVGGILFGYNIVALVFGDN